MCNAQGHFGAGPVPLGPSVVFPELDPGVPDFFAFLGGGGGGGGGGGCSIVPDEFLAVCLVRAASDRVDSATEAIMTKAMNVASSFIVIGSEVIAH